MPRSEELLHCINNNNNLTYLGNIIQLLILQFVVSHKQTILLLYILIFFIGTCFDGQDVHHYLVVGFSCTKYLLMILYHLGNECSMEYMFGESEALDIVFLSSAELSDQSTTLLLEIQ